MRAPQQSATVDRLERQAQIEIKKIRARGREAVNKHWVLGKRVLRTIVHDVYREDWGKEKWAMPRAAGTIRKIAHQANHWLGQVHAASLSVAQHHFREIYRQTVLRHAYALDMATPDSFTPRIPQSRLFMTEAAVSTYVGPDANTGWKVRWSSWYDAYAASLESNLRLGALNDSSVLDAEDEVNQTTVGTPSYDVGDALDRIFMAESVAVQALGASDVAQLNADLVDQQVWQTSFSTRVCDICDSQQGLTDEEADYEIPAHPNCECYWRVVPKSYADLLKSGDPDDQELARRMDARGEVPGTMLITNDAGEVAAKAIVSFDNWVAGMRPVVGSR